MARFPRVLVHLLAAFAWPFGALLGLWLDQQLDLPWSGFLWLLAGVPLWLTPLMLIYVYAVPYVQRGKGASPPTDVP